MAYNAFAAAQSGGPANLDYRGMLKQSQDQYSKILAGYQNALAGQQRRSQRVAQGYNKLENRVLGNLAGSGTARSQEIADFYTAQAGQQNQNLISRGLGNTTVASSVGRGLAYDQSKAQTDLSNRLSNQYAQYQSNIGLAGLNYRGDANQQRTGLMGAQLGYQGDWQKSLLGAGLTAAGMQNQYALSSMNSGGGVGPEIKGLSHGDILTRPSSPGLSQYYSGEADPYVSIGGYGGGGGGGSYGGDVGLGGGAYGADYGAGYGEEY